MMNLRNRGNKKILDFFNFVKRPSEIVKRVKNNGSNRNDISKHANEMLSSFAKKIIAEKNKLPQKKFKSISHISEMTGIESNILTDIYFGLMPGIVDCPAVLFPVRLETRYIDNELLVRIYPDQIAIELLQRKLTDAEKSAKDLYCEEKKVDEGAAWNRLVNQFGSKRAAWIASCDCGDNQEIEYEEVDEPKFRILPDKFVVSLYKAGKDVDHNVFKEVTGNPIPDELPVMCESSLSYPSSSASECWVHDFNAALEVGMAVRFKNITPEDFPLSRIIAVGVKNKKTTQESQLLLGELLEDHRYASGISFLKHGTPTNNTGLVTTEHSERKDNESSVPSNGNTNASYLKEFLGFREEQLSFLDEVENAGKSVDSIDVRETNELFWRTTGGYFFRSMLSGIPISGNGHNLLKDHFRDYVRARGIFPAIRIGNNPYGILPVSTYRTWKPSMLDALENNKESFKFDENLYRVLSYFYYRWKWMSKDKEAIPVVGNSDDLDRELISILSMGPNSSSVGVRTVMDSNFVRWLVNNIDLRYFGLNGAAHNKYLDDNAGLEKAVGILKQLSPDSNEEELKESFILKILNWGRAYTNYELVRDENTPENPLKYLSQLMNEEEIEMLPKTILYTLLTRSSINMNDESVRKFLNNYKDDVDGLEKQLSDILDLNTHRLDAWITSLANRRLQTIRKSNSTGIIIGAYGFLEDLSLEEKLYENGGFIHAPGVGQAATGAILRNAYLAHKEDNEEGNAFKISLTSDRVRNAKRLIDGVREGQELGALLGYQFERYLRDGEQSKYISKFRDVAPLKAGKGEISADNKPAEAIAARNVVDGRELAEKWQKEEIDLNNIGVEDGSGKVRLGLEQLVDSLDAVKDLLMYEGVFQSVQGNFERSGAALDAISGQGRPPEIEGIKTPVSGRSLKHRVCMLLPTNEPLAGRRLESFNPGAGRMPRPFHPRVVAEPRLQAWLENIFLNNDPDKLAKIGCVAVVNNDPDNLTKIGRVATANKTEFFIDLKKLDINLIDFLYLSAFIPEESDVAGDIEIEQRIKYFVRSEIDNFTDKIDIKIEWNRTGMEDGSGLSMYEALVIARKLLNLLGRATILKPDSLTIPENPDNFNGSLEMAYKELKERVREVKYYLEKLKNDPFTPEWFLKVAQFGIAEAIPELPSAEHKLNIEVELDKRIDLCEQVLEQTFDEGDYDSAIKAFTNTLKSIFGNSFVVFPPIKLTKDVLVAINYSDNQFSVFEENGQHRINLWLQQAVQTHPALQSFEETLILGDAWKNSEEFTASSEFKAIQLPANKYRFWQAFADEEIKEAINQIEDAERYQKRFDDDKTDGGPRSVTSIVFHTPTNYFTREKSFACGLLIDQWDEIIPAEKITTGVSINYNQPGAQAPQSILLAVPDKLNLQATKKGSWANETKVRDVVYETMDLMNIRGVDLDALKDVGRIFPALFLPPNPKA